MIIYKATNRLNDMSYIGQTVSSLSARRGSHICDALAKRTNCYFHKAIRKYNIENFSWTILHDNITNIDILNKLEIFYIGYYNTFEAGYNLTEGGRNASHTMITKLKISKANTGKTRTDGQKRIMSKKGLGSKNNFYGKKHSPEALKKISDSKKGKKATPETKAKLSKMRMGTGNSFYGKKHSNKSKKKMSDTQKGKYTGKDSFAGKAILIDNVYFSTLTEASKILGVHLSTIFRRLKRQTPGYSYL